MSQPDDGDGKDEVEEEPFGYSVEGSWEDIVGFGEEIVSTFEEHDVEQDTVSEWDAWRPRSGEQEDEMREKTVEKAKVEEGDETSETAAETAEKLSETREKTAEGDITEAAEKASEASKSAGKTVGDASRDVVRAVEDRVYRRITRTNPLYFDSENFNASLKVVESIGEKMGKMKEKIVNGEADDEGDTTYRMSINAESQEVEEALNDEFEDTDDG
ncbi:DUF5828 family protein [Haladaptatus sp. F3-133]|jgi:hypothetical protein|uniref:DUF5828 family protein n=1 Tax=Halorutilus salinus TaxID=2487751 RepID=A0A9Q4C4A6_9EURY|nr:DUF5828 family protein [Halorutilus salinus]MCX2819198.1 DUF5828 family protein [Halorutilus salinus]